MVVTSPVAGGHPRVGRGGGEEDGVRFQTVLTREDAADEEDDDEEKKHHQRWCVVNQRIPAVVVLVVEGRLHGFVLVDEKVCLSRREADIRTRQPFFEILHAKLIKLTGFTGRQGVDAVVIVLVETVIGLSDETAYCFVALALMVGHVLTLDVIRIVISGSDDALIFVDRTGEGFRIDRSGPFVFRVAQVARGGRTGMRVAIFVGVAHLQRGAVADDCQANG